MEERREFRVLENDKRKVIKGPGRLRSLLTEVALFILYIQM